jgi:hypothetical protein
MEYHVVEDNVFFDPMPDVLVVCSTLTTWHITVLPVVRRRRSPPTWLRAMKLIGPQKRPSEITQSALPASRNQHPADRHPAATRATAAAERKEPENSTLTVAAATKSNKAAATSVQPHLGDGIRGEESVDVIDSHHFR